jgi:hypothetical protein
MMVFLLIAAWGCIANKTFLFPKKKYLKVLPRRGGELFFFFYTPFIIVIFTCFHHHYHLSPAAASSRYGNTARDIATAVGSAISASDLKLHLGWNKVGLRIKGVTEENRRHYSCCMGAK